jgi:hypothetical protein
MNGPGFVFWAVVDGAVLIWLVFVIAKAMG